MDMFTAITDELYRRYFEQDEAGSAEVFPAYEDYTGHTDNTVNT